MQPSFAAFRAALASFVSSRALKLAVGPIVVLLIAGAIFLGLPLVMLMTGVVPPWVQALYGGAGGVAQTLLVVLYQLALILLVALWSMPGAVAQIGPAYSAAGPSPDAMAGQRGALAHYIGTYIVLCAVIQFLGTVPLLYGVANLAAQGWLAMRLMPYLALRKRASAGEFAALTKAWRLPFAGVAIAGVVLSGLIAAAISGAIALLLPGPAAFAGVTIGRVLGMLFLVYWFAHLSLRALAAMRGDAASARPALP
ncbi:hypothetical protein [Cupriavidus cauae]|uniref:Glycerophosphoryl diester phosphodiesterase membrane domain-containing protein n=1 Tax=Cupriavidus cauae TaxID=2608999 RepID=A0A5M8AFB5_9BURK|nr:hypothetical protein [Cupriavidus cauae]KAA6119574.1 hypothetical protein F1599_18915 [Cupriavidus cauae]